MLRRTVLVRAVAMSAITNCPLPFRAQSDVAKAAKTNNYGSPYWSTLSQIRRGLRGVLKPGEKPVETFLDIGSVVPFKSLPESVQRDVMRKHPPYFESPVGILSSGFKWNSVGATRLKRVLLQDDFRSLWVEEPFAAVLSGPKFKLWGRVDISSQSKFFLYNAEQLVYPSRGEPPVGVAIDFVTGKRVAQPAHDVLLATGILRGYDTPLWINKKQLSLLSREPPKRALPVSACTMEGICVPLSSIKNPRLLKLLTTRLHDSQFTKTAIYIFNANGWERSLSAAVATAFKAHVINGSVCRQWVNIDEVEAAIPDMQCDVAIGAPRVDLSLVTAREFYNVGEFKDPHLVTTPNRPIAILNGRLLGKQDETRLRIHSLARKFSSPLWLTARTAKSMGVGIKKNEKPIVLERRTTGDVTVYNLDDFVNPKQIITQFPHAGKSNVHKILESGWKVVLGKHKQKTLGATRRASKLWVSSSEVVISGFRLKPDVQPTSLSRDNRSAARDADGDEGSADSTRVLYNAQQTTDPVRVIGLSPYYVRPQGAIA